MRRINLQVQGGGGRRSGATLTDDNAAIANLDKQKYKLFCESSLPPGFANPFSLQRPKDV